MLCSKSSVARTSHAPASVRRFEHQHARHDGKSRKVIGQILLGQRQTFDGRDLHARLQVDHFVHERKSHVRNIGNTVNGEKIRRRQHVDSDDTPIRTASRSGPPQDRANRPFSRRARKQPSRFSTCSASGPAAKRAGTSWVVGLQSKPPMISAFPERHNRKTRRSAAFASPGRRLQDASGSGLPAPEGTQTAARDQDIRHRTVDNWLRPRPSGSPGHNSLSAGRVHGPLACGANRAATCAR